MPDEGARGPHRGDRFLGPSDFAGLSEIQVLTSYDGVDLEFIGTGPRVGPADPEVGPLHEGAWLITWLEGGRMSAAPSTPPELAGVPRWLAVPLSGLRREQVLSEDVSLRETISFAEWDPYLLMGVDPLNPESVRPVRVVDLPRGYLPTGDVSVRGKKLHGIQMGGDGPSTDVLLHLVPDGSSAPSPSLADAGAIQEAISRFLGWTAHAFVARHAPSPPTGNRGQLGLPGAWTRLALQRASPGTLCLEARITADDQGQRDALKAALEELKRVSESNARGAERTGDRFAPVVQFSLLGLMDLLRQLRISVTVKWDSGGTEEAALIGSSTAQASADFLSREVVSGLEARGQRFAIVRVPLSPEDLERLDRDADPAAGGFEKLLSDLRGQVVTEHGHSFLELRPDQVEKVVRYVQRYGGGGAQERLRPVYLALYQLGISFVGIR